MESFFKTLKVEWIYQGRYETRDQARLDIVDWIEGFYNRQRLHSSIGYHTPQAVSCADKTGCTAGGTLSISAIENSWSKLKVNFRKTKVRTAEALDDD